jgi:hypothetical protein
MAKTHKHMTRRRRELGEHPTPALEALFQKIESQKSAHQAKKQNQQRRK